MPLTKEQIQTYMDAPGLCPFCRGAIPVFHDEYPEYDDLDGKEVCMNWTCPGCKKSWRAYFKLHDIEELDGDGCAMPND